MFSTLIANIEKRNAKVLQVAEGLRSTFATEKTMVKTKEELTKLLRNAEVARFTSYMIERYTKYEESKITKATLRDDLCREMKAIRPKLGCKEKEVFPTCLLETCLKVLWDQ